MAPGHPVDAHGLPLSTTLDAAGWYRLAQSDCWDRTGLEGGLRGALSADPHFAVAMADSSILAGVGGPVHPAPKHAWERHHVEVVVAASRGDIRRAVDLLRDHLTVVPCDPVAMAIVLDAGGAVLLEDVLLGLPPCHCRRGVYGERSA